MVKIIIGPSMKNRSLVKDTIERLEKLGFEAFFPNIDYSIENKDVAKDLEEKSKLARDHY